MAEKENSRDTAYKYRENNEPHRQTGNSNERNNNTTSNDVNTREPNVEQANDTGIGDSGINDDKLTKYTQNHSSSA